MVRSSRKQERRNKLIIGFIIVFLMVTSVIGMVMVQNSGLSGGSQSYGDHVFVQDGSVWITNIGNTPYYFDYFPSDTLDVPLDQSIPEKMKEANVVLFTYDPYPAVGDINQTNYLIQRSIFFLSYSLENKYGISSVSGFTNSSDFPSHKEVTCADAEYKVPVVYFTFGNSSRIYEESDCIIVQAVSPVDFAILKDRLNVDLVLDDERN